MRTRPRLSDWLGAAAPNVRQRIPSDFTDRMTLDSTVDVTSTTSGWHYLRAALRSRAPGQWSVSRQELARHLTSSIYLAINTMQKHAAAATKQVFERTNDQKTGDIELGPQERICQLLESPNNDDTWGDVMEGITQQKSLTGISLTWTPQENDNDVPTELYVIPTASALPWPPSPIYPHGSYLIQPYYPYGPFSTIPSYQSAAGARIPAEQIIRIKDVHPILRYEGYATLTAISKQIDVIEGMDTARFNTQQRGVDPSVVITFDPNILNPNKVDLVRLRTQIEAAAAGPANAGKILFAPTGGDVEVLSHTPAEMAWTEGWDQLVSFALACFGVPKSVAGLSEDSSYANLYASIKQFYVLSLNPLLRKVAGHLTKHLLQEFFGAMLYLKLTGERIDQWEQDKEKIDIALKAGNLARVDELRKMLEWEPLGGEEGKAFAGGKEQQQPGMPGLPGQMPINGDYPDLDAFAQRRQGAGRLNSVKDDLQDEDVERSRPRNTQGRDSLGPRKSVQADRIANALERAKTNGKAHAPYKVNDGMREFVRSERV